ncbi:CSC1-like protein HYP1 isoform X2 [Cornus florida]|uniref:CSC1-like protein HYP1 isoform X2 n=1 Tax=Cornus florida TaxID=4283 RepID=UPI0028A20A87|nr:CSC1-like protein HYP1 isoform X2 [Cornus florida]
MILSALLTSVGINLGLCLLFCTLYSILRKQPGNISVYAPRLIAERNAQERTDFNLERLLPSPGWVREAWRPSEAELLSISGLDAVVFMRIFTFGFKVFSFAGIIGVFILLPINYLGNQLSADFSDLANKSLDSFTISNVDNGSNWLWIHFSAAYVFTAIVCYLLYFEYNYISSKRIAYFYSSKPQPHQFTILVRSIPASSSSSFSESVESFFMENYPSTYLSNSVVRRTSKIQGLISDADKMYRKLAHLKSTTHTQQRFRRDGFLGLFGRKVNILDQYEKKLEDLEDNMRMEQTSIVGKEVPAAFVSFKSRFVAAIALHIQQGVNPIEWVTEPAPEPRDVYWPFFSASFIKRWIWKLVVFVAYILITVLFLIPVVLVQGLTNLEQLETWFPFLESILELTVVSQVITGYLPSLILQLFLSFVPPIMIMFSSLQGYIALSQIAKSACIKASFFIAYVVTSGWTSTSSELFRLIPLICSFFKKASDEVPSISYHSEIPKILFFGLLGITYFLLSPLILPFLLVYYCLGFIIYRNQLLNVYAPKFETGGKFWPIVHNSTIFSLVLMHIIAIGIFGLKKLPVASSLIIPLPVLTLLFNDYCRKRYLPIFKEYPAECLIKKDRDDQNDPTISDFLDKLVTAYQDPALMPTQHSGSGDRRTSPLLHAAED